MGYVSRRPPDSALVAQMHQVRTKHPCYGYRRTHMELTQGVKGVLNHKRVHRVWRDHGMKKPKAHMIPSSDEGSVLRECSGGEQAFTS